MTESEVGSSDERRSDYVERFLVGRDYEDVFPWTFTRWLDADGGKDGLGSICTPNGRRPDGTMHTYWSVGGGMWEPDAVLICEAVNAVVQRGWRARLARRLLGLRSDGVRYEDTSHSARRPNDGD